MSNVKKLVWGWWADIAYIPGRKALVTQILHDKWSSKGVTYLILKKKSLKVYGYWRFCRYKLFSQGNVISYVPELRKKGKDFSFFFNQKCQCEWTLETICWETCSFTRYVIFYCQGESGIRKLIWTRVFCKCNTKKILWNGSWKTKNNWKRKAPKCSRGIYFSLNYGEITNSFFLTCKLYVASTAHHHF